MTAYREECDLPEFAQIDMSIMMENLWLAADEIGLTGLAFEGQKNAVQGLTRESEEKETTLFSGVKKWLDIYFSGVEPAFKYRFIWKEPIFRCVCGRCFARSRMERQRHTAQSQADRT